MNRVKSFFLCLDLLRFYIQQLIQVGILMRYFIYKKSFKETLERNHVMVN